MSKSARYLIVSAIGVAVAILVAAAEAVIQSLTGYNIFGFSLFVFVPVGAILTGLAAASGYYFACKWLQLRPSISLLAQMIVVAALTNLLIYYFEYVALTWGDPRATDLEVFAWYLGEYITHQNLAVGRGQMSMGEVGDFGYWLAAIDFVGFLIGGGIMVSMLLGAPTCKECTLFYQTRAKRNRFFYSIWEAKRYYDGLFSQPVDSAEFAAQCSLGDSSIRMAGPGAVHITTTLYCCPSCKGQAWADQGKSSDGRNWVNNSSINRLIVLPKGADLTQALKREGENPGKTGIDLDTLSNPHPS
jgi:hypothetical protein